jgi:hypothetical protein
MQKMAKKEVSKRRCLRTEVSDQAQDTGSKKEEASKANATA